MDKAFPNLQVEACKQWVLTHYLRQINNAHLAFSVKQQKPATLDSAVSTTLEMEPYLPQKGGSIGVAATDQDVQMAAVHNKFTPGSFWIQVGD